MYSDSINYMNAYCFRIFALYFAQFLKARLSYKWDFFAGILSSLLSAMGGVLFVVLLIDGSAVPDLRGWNRDHVLFIYGYSLIATAIFGLVAPNLYRFGERYIIEGQFDRVLLRPLNSLLQVLFESFNLESMGSFLLGIVLVVYTAERAQIALGVVDIGWLIVSAMSGAIILISIFTILSSCSFHFEDRLGLTPPMVNLMAFSRYPLPIFNQTLQIILSWVIPFAFVSYYPATHFFGAEGRLLLGYCTPIVALICAGIASMMWKIGVGKYASTGS